MLEILRRKLKHLPCGKDLYELDTDPALVCPHCQGKIDVENLVVLSEREVCINRVTGELYLSKGVDDE